MNIPWQNRMEFQEAVGFLAVIDRQRGRQLDPVRDLAREILNSFDRLSAGMDSLCNLTCPGCRDNCCKRATIWYDFRDMLYLYFGPGKMPQRQLEKSPGPSGIRCANLRTFGCVLPRARRPFVCTWYFCPDQKILPAYAHLNAIILKIKEMRGQMEHEFCRITSGRGVNRLNRPDINE